MQYNLNQLPTFSIHPLIESTLFKDEQESSQHDSYMQYTPSIASYSTRHVSPIYDSRYMNDSLENDGYRRLQMNYLKDLGKKEFKILGSNSGNNDADPLIMKNIAQYLNGDNRFETQSPYTDLVRPNSALNNVHNEILNRDDESLPAGGPLISNVDDSDTASPQLPSTLDLSLFSAIQRTFGIMALLNDRNSQAQEDVYMRNESEEEDSDW